MWKFGTHAILKVKRGDLLQADIERLRRVVGHATRGHGARSTPLDAVSRSRRSSGDDTAPRIDAMQELHLIYTEEFAGDDV